MLPYAIKVAGELRSRGLRVEVGVMRRRLGRELSNVDKLGIPFAIIVGPEEAEKGLVAVRDMRTREQHQLTLEEAFKAIQEALGRGEA